MYRILFLAIIVLASCQSKEEPSVDAERSSSLDEFIRIPTTKDGKIDKEKLAVADFDHIAYDFDTIVEGAKVNHEFTFRNTGAVPLVIADVTSSCGCTIPNYPDTAIAPGEASSISAIFNSEGRRGIQNKTISIYSNTIPNPIELKLKGFVLTKE